jgi:hypothetical protein
MQEKMMSGCWLRKALAVAALGACSIGTVGATDIAFSRSGRDDTITDVMYYRDGSWQRILPVSEGGLRLREFHAKIVGAWLDARAKGMEVDCSPEEIKSTGFREDICKLPRPLSQLPAEKLLAHLATLPPDAEATRGEPITNVLTPDILNRLVQWWKAPSSDLSGDAYARLLWNSNASRFRLWYQVNAPERAPARFKGAAFGGSMGDCVSDAVLIAVDEQAPRPLSEAGVASDAEVEKDLEEAQRPGSGWLATQKGGFTWGDFRDIRDADADAKRVSGDSGLAAQIKSRWSEREGAVIDRLPATPRENAELKKSLRAEGFSDFRVRRGVWAEKRITLFYFDAKKIFELPMLKDKNGDGSVIAEYRGWAALYPDGRLDWPSARMQLTAAGKLSPESYTRFSPRALLELDGRQFLIADSSEYSEKAAVIENEVFELADGKFTSRGVYPGVCD